MFVPAPAVDAATSFLRELVRARPRELARWFHDDATWWVDTGIDRAAGAVDAGRGAPRGSPLHGTIPAAEKLDLLSGQAGEFPRGCRYSIRRAFGTADVAVVEVAIDGLHASGHRYRNNAALVVDVDGGRIAAVREYLDTDHALRVLGDPGAARRTTAPVRRPPDVEASSPWARAALRFLAAIGHADPEAVLAACGEHATWWADGGRRRSRPDGPTDRAAPQPMFGRVPVPARAPLVAALGAMFGGTWWLRPRRVVESGELVAVEAESFGEHPGGVVYQNRYCFVFQVRRGLVEHVREYADVHHGLDVFRRVRELEGRLQE